MFRFIGLAEEAGSGMPKIVQAWRDLGFQLPSIDVGTERYEFSITLRQAHLLSEEDRFWLRGLGHHWSEPEQLALVTARHEGYVDNLSLRSLSGQHRADATRVLGSLRDRGLLVMMGDRRRAHYVLGPEAYHQLTLDFEEGAHDQSEITQAQAEITQAESEITQAQAEITQAPNEIAEVGVARLTTIASRIQRRAHLNAAERDSVLVELCAVMPLAVRDVAELIGRSEDHTGKILGRLVSEGRLAYLFPLQPRHPRQRYTVPSGESTSAEVPTRSLEPQ
jgi:hypothetical protein